MKFNWQKKMDLNIRKMTNPPSPEHKFNNNKTQISFMLRAGSQSVHLHYKRSAAATPPFLFLIYHYYSFTTVDDT